jgi:hypothetical protein
LSAIQDHTPIPDAIGARIWLDSEIDFEMSAVALAIGAALGLGQSWAAALLGIPILSGMIGSHGHQAIQYGLLGDVAGFE